MTSAPSQQNPAASPHPRRSRAIFLVKIVVAAGIIAWLLRSGRLDFHIWGQVRKPRYLWAAGAAAFLSMLLPVWRWFWLTRIQQLSIGFATALRMTWLGSFAGTFLPGAAGGDLAKAYVACRHQPRARARTVSTVLLDRCIGLSSLLVFGALAGLMLLAQGARGRLAQVASIPILLCLASGAAVALLAWRPSSGLLMRRLPPRFARAYDDSFALYRAAWGRLVMIWLFSGVCNLASFLAYYYTAAAIGMNLTLLETFTVIPLVIVANCIPITPSGIGVGESVASTLFGFFGLTQGALLMLLVRVGSVALSLPGVIPLLGRHGPGPASALAAGIPDQ